MTGACDDCLRRTDLVASLAALAGHRVAPAGRARRGCSRCPTRRCSRPATARRSARATTGSTRPSPGMRCATPASPPCAVARPSIRRGCATCPTRPPCCTSRATRSASASTTRSPSSAPAGRRQYGLTVARDLGCGLSSAGVTVVSGLALGVDSAAHAGALEGTAAPVAVLAGGADRPYPASKRQLHAAVRAAGAVVSEMPPGFGIHRWAFVARNRLIAALAQVVVVVEATERSGSLTTADLGAERRPHRRRRPGPRHLRRRFRHQRPDPRRRGAGPRRPRRARRPRPSSRAPDYDTTRPARPGAGARSSSSCSTRSAPAIRRCRCSPPMDSTRAGSCPVSGSSKRAA